MTSLARRILSPRDVARSTDLALSLQQWAEQMQFGGLNYGLNGFAGTPQQSPTNPQEDIGSSFQGYVEGAYKSNGIVFACCVARMLIFSEARFQYQRMRDGRPGELFSKAELSILETPWRNGTTGDLLTRAISDVDLGGNFYGYRSGGVITRMRPDWVTIILGSRTKRKGWAPGDLDTEAIGYFYHPGGHASGRDPVLLFPENVAHWAPIKDPTATYRGMSWMTPMVREILGDKAAMDHKLKFFENGATVSLIAKLPAEVKSEAFQTWVTLFKDAHQGAHNAYETVFLGGGADLTPVGSDMKQIDFKTVQGHGETRVCAAARIPPIIVGLSEGLESATYSLPYDGSVWTSAGPRPIGEIRAGDTVWTSVAGKIQAQRVTWQGCTGENAIYTVRTKNRAFRATGNHPVLMPDGSWRNVEDLAVGDRVIEPLGLPDLAGGRLPDGKVATTQVMQWLGAFTGDGCLSGSGTVRMCLPSADRVRGYYEAIPPTLFTKGKPGQCQAPGRRARDGHTAEMVALRARGLTYRQIRDEMGLTLHPMSVRDRVHHATREYVGAREPVVTSPARHGFQFCSTTAVRWHHAMGVTGGAKTKRVPGWVFGLREELRLAYLAGVVDTDGHVGKDGRLVVHFANRALVEDVRMLLVSCAIQCSNIAEQRFAPSVLPNPGTQAEYTAWKFTASSAVEVARIPFADGLYRERVDANQHRQRVNTSGMFKIRSIERGPVEPVYDIEVDGGGHSFLTDGVVVHNSNYGQARRAFADGTMRPLWRGIAGALGSIVSVPSDARLWYDARDVSFLQEDEKDAAAIRQVNAASIRSLVECGYTPVSVVAAVLADDYGLLEHSGLYSVQLQSPGSSKMPDPALVDPAATPASSGSNGRRLLKQHITGTRN